MRTQTVKIPGRILERETLNCGCKRIATNWVIKGEETASIRHTFGYDTVEDAKRVELSSNTVVVGFNRYQFDDGTELFELAVNCWN